MLWLWIDSVHMSDWTPEFSTNACYELKKILITIISQELVWKPILKPWKAQYYSFNPHVCFRTVLCWGNWAMYWRSSKHKVVFLLSESERESEIFLWCLSAFLSSFFSSPLTFFVLLPLSLSVNRPLQLCYSKVGSFRCNLNWWKVITYY